MNALLRTSVDGSIYRVREKKSASFLLHKVSRSPPLSALLRTSRTEHARLLWHQWVFD
jgi:hypothetical protein